MGSGNRGSGYAPTVVARSGFGSGSNPRRTLSSVSRRGRRASAPRANYAVVGRDCTAALALAALRLGISQCGHLSSLA